jgi:hypothetical protein
MEDVFNRSLEMSDPLLSSISLKKKLAKKAHKKLPNEIQQLLFEKDLNNSNESYDEDEMCEMLDEVYNELDGIELESEKIEEEIPTQN